VSLDPGEEEVIVAGGSVMVYELCPRSGEELRPGPVTAIGPILAWLDDEGNLHYDATQLSKGVSYSLIVSISAHLGHTIQVVPSDSLPEDQACVRVIVVATFRLKSGPGWEFDSLIQHWRSDISSVFERMSHTCCDDD